MKQKFYGVLLCVLSAWSVGAQQINVRLNLAYSVFVVGEPVVLRVDLQNNLRRPIDVGMPGAQSALILEVTKGGRYNELQPYNKEPLVAPFQIMSGQSMQHTLAADKWFSLEDEGRYVVRAVVVYEGKRYESVQKSFDVVPGITVSSGAQMFANREKLRRQFRLVNWHRNQTERLFLRIDDEPGERMWDTIDLGVMMRGAPAKLDISPEGEVTVLHRATQDAFLRTVLWSLPDVVEVVERNTLVDPEISASQRVNALYGDDLEGEANSKAKSWWKFWR